MTIEMHRIEIDRLPAKQGLMAATTSATFTAPLGPQRIECMAMWARDGFIRLANMRVGDECSCETHIKPESLYPCGAVSSGS
jgi:hypothetical protein